MAPTHPAAGDGSQEFLHAVYRHSLTALFSMPNLLTFVHKFAFETPL